MGRLLCPGPEAGAVEEEEGAEEEQRGWTVVEAGAEVGLSGGCCLRGEEVEGEVIGGGAGWEVGVLWRGAEVGEERPECQGGTGEEEEVRRLELWRGEEEGEGEPLDRPGTEVAEEGALCCGGGEEGEEEGEGRRGMEGVEVLASGARSSQPRRLLSPR